MAWRARHSAQVARDGESRVILKRYPEVHPKIVEFTTHAIENSTLYSIVRFKDETDFSLRYVCDMFVMGADI